MPIINAVKSNASFLWSSVASRLQGRNIVIAGACVLGAVVAAKLIWDYFKKQPQQSNANQQLDLAKDFFPKSKLLPSSLKEVEILSGMSIPPDIWRRICEFLPTSAILKLSRTCKALVGLRTDTQVLNIMWKHHINDLEKIIFGKEAWNTHFGDIGEVDPIPEALIKALEEPCPFTKGKKVKETHIAFWIPAQVKGTPLTLSTLGELVKKPLKGFDSKYCYLDDKIVMDYGDTPVKKGLWILLTKTVIEGSRNTIYVTQKQRVESYPGYEVPTLFPTAIALYMHYARTGQRLYNENPLTYTWCQDQVDKIEADDWHLAVGGFGLGLYADEYPGKHYDYPIGVGGMRKFVSG